MLKIREARGIWVGVISPVTEQRKTEKLCFTQLYICNTKRKIN